MQHKDFPQLNCTFAGTNPTYSDPIMGPTPENTSHESAKAHRFSGYRNREILHIFNTFFHNESTGGILLLVCAIVAVTLASVPGGEWFESIWTTHASIGIGDFSIEMSLRHWINDALMAIFFFVVGLEIKREMLVGQLSSIKRSALPIVAALGGMLVPAGIYWAFNAGHPESIQGWGIPMATDIAFAIGILSLLGNRVPPSLKVFLTALAIVDDIGAIIVLAIFYPTHALHLEYLAYAGLILAVLAAFNALKVKNKYLYILPGIAMWYFTFLSGIHATIAGVLLAMVIPSKGSINEIRFQSRISLLLEKFKLTSNRKTIVLTSPEQQHIIHSMSTELKSVDPLLHRFESKLHPIVTFIIMPLFALANAGVALDFSSISSGGLSPVTLGIVLGLLIGKPAGIFLFSFVSIRLKLAARPTGVTWTQLLSISVLGGIGFTMSIFINNLAFSSESLVDIGKISILVASASAAILGLLAMSLSCRGKAPELTAEEILPEETNRIKAGGKTGEPARKDI